MASNDISRVWSDDTRQALIAVIQRNDEINDQRLKHHFQDLMGYLTVMRAEYLNGLMALRHELAPHGPCAHMPLQGHDTKNEFGEDMIAKRKGPTDPMTVLEDIESTVKHFASVGSICVDAHGTGERIPECGPSNKEARCRLALESSDGAACGKDVAGIRLDVVTNADEDTTVASSRTAESSIRFAGEGDDPAEEADADPASVVLKESSALASVFTEDDDIGKPAYHVEDLYSKTGLCQKIARSTWFEHVTIGVVVANAVYIGFDSDYNDAANIYEAALPFQVFSQFFCVYFTWELTVRFFAFARKADCLQDGWFKFDTFLVSTMILDIWVLMPSLMVVSGGGGQTLPTQPLRMLRLFKLTRMARLMKAFPELVTMIKGLIRSLRAITSSMILIGLMVYVWAIMIHMLMKHENHFNLQLREASGLDFSTMTRCIWTLLMDGTLMLDNAAPLMTDLLFSDDYMYKLAGFCFLVYAMLSALLVLQMLIGVLCDVVSKVGDERQDAQDIGLVKQELLADLSQFAGDDGKVSQTQLLSVMSNPASKAVLKKLNINTLFLLELQSSMFQKPTDEVSIKTCLDMMILCRGDKPATVEAMAGGLNCISREIADIKAGIKQLSSKR